jgi:D-alanyl-D-alanine carboxypeptidase
MYARALVAAILIIGGLFLLGSFGSTVTYLPFFGNQAAVLTASDADSLSARSALVVDRTNGATVLDKDADAPYPIASIAKLFTAYAADHSSEIDNKALIVWQDYTTEGDAGGLWLGETYTVRELLFPLLLSSSNDAAAAIYRTLGASAYAGALQQLYADAGLAKTTITEPSGLSAADRSTARDLARFLAYLDTHDRYLLDITTLPSYVGQYRGLLNNDPAASLDGFRGGKHGYTPEAGHTFAGIFRKGDTEYTVILLDSDDLEGDLSLVVPRLP